MVLSPHSTHRKGELKMTTYVCNFCGGDHGATECPEELCFDCLKSTCQCNCPGDRISAGEALDVLDDKVWEMIPAKDVDALEAEFDSSRPVEFYAEVVNRYPGFPSWIRDLFQTPPDGDDRIWNASRKYGAGCVFAFETLLKSSEQVRELVDASEDEEIYLVHGFGRMPGQAVDRYTHHAWLEVGDFMVDCGTMYHHLTRLDREATYAECDVCHTTRYTSQQANRLAIETHSFGPWEEPPAGLVLAKPE